LQEYQDIYGPETVVLYQCGCFYEIYGVDSQRETIGLVREADAHLQLKIAITAF
jgi:hypothetical protein